MDNAAVTPPMPIPIQSRGRRTPPRTKARSSAASTPKPAALDAATREPSAAAKPRRAASGSGGSSGADDERAVPVGAPGGASCCVAGGRLRTHATIPLAPSPRLRCSERRAHVGMRAGGSSAVTTPLTTAPVRMPVCEVGDFLLTAVSLEARSNRAVTQWSTFASLGAPPCRRAVAPVTTRRIGRLDPGWPEWARKDWGPSSRPLLGNPRGWAGQHRA